MIARTVGVAALVAVMTLACKGDTGAQGTQGPPGLQGVPGPEGAIGPPGVGWADAGSDIVTVNTGNVGVGTNAPVAKLDVNGSINGNTYQFQGTQAFGLERSGMVTDIARGKPVTVTAGTVLQGGGPTNEDSEGSLWKTTVFPSSMTVDLGRGYPPIEQIAWESHWRGDYRFVPEWSGTGAYTLEHSPDGSTWTQAPTVPPVAGDFFVVTLSPAPLGVRYLRLTVKAPHIPGNEVHVALFRALNFVGGDNSAVDARRLYTAPGTGPLRLWGQGRPGIVRYGTGGVETGLCVNGGVRFGLSNARVQWEGAEAACPAGTWVCTQAERGSAACDTARPDTTCDYRDVTGACIDTTASTQWGHVADNGFQNGVEGKHVNENGTPGGGGAGNYYMPSWCCSY